ncbi:alkane 1-monooxygenase [Palleronia rufa]|uniref:alkane 1-monooxygenase n=1 Tax=Palleronia rufa TaxID=1530186 RepID=UPI000566B1B7|nr:alkane 1-monooxygenase [Palleronia rufa]
MDHLSKALPFWLSLMLVPVILAATWAGGWWLLLVPASTWWLFSTIDSFAGLEESNRAPDTPDAQLFWYRLVTLIWFPIQAALTFGLIWWVSRSDMGGVEKFGVFFGMGVLSGTVGITYAHELMHQRNRVERWLADLLLALVFYSHFRSEHLLVHHRYVGTPKDPVTARYNEGFHRFYPRVLRQSLVSSFRAEAAMLARRGRPWWDARNPFWRYWALQSGFVAIAFALGGAGGVALLLVQAGVAIWQLELVNYVEHYGLTREHLGDGRYEHVRPRHSWNASHKASNWLLINLQRHSDHHYKPDRRFPLLQTYGAADAPQLPASYPVMTVAAMIPPLWRRIMNPRVRAWRRTFYPQIDNWRPYNRATNPPPR